MMVYVHGLRDVPEAFLNSRKKYSLQYELLGQKVRFPIKLEGEPSEGLFKINIEKIKLFHFFAESREVVRQYIKAKPALEIVLLED